MNFIKKIFVVLFFISTLIFSKFAIAETLEEISAEINDIREQISNLKPSDVDEVVKIDKALKELDAVVEFINERNEIGDVKGAVSTLNFAEESLKDITKIVPKEYETEKLGELKEFSEQELEDVMKITEGINKKKETSKKVLIESMMETNSNGLDVYTVSQKLTNIGVETISSEEITETLMKVNNISPSKKLTENLQQEVRELNQELQKTENTIKVKEEELAKAKSASPEVAEAKTKSLEKRLKDATLKKDFAIVENNKKTKKEIEALEKYAHVLTTGFAEDDDQYEKELKLALREADVILSADPKQHRAFDIEKFGTIAGLSEDLIKKGMEAVYNDDWDTQKEITKNILEKLSTVKRKLPSGSYIDFSDAASYTSESELNVLMAEEQAKDKAIYAVLNAAKINVEGPTRDQRELISYTSMIGDKIAPGTWTPSYRKAFDVQYDKIVAATDLADKKNELSSVTEQYKNIEKEWRAGISKVRELQNQKKFTEAAELQKDFSNHDYYRKSLDLRSKASKLGNEVFSIEINAQQEAKVAVKAQQEGLAVEIEATYGAAIQDLASEVEKTLSAIPTISQKQINEVYSLVYGGKFHLWGSTEMAEAMGAKMKAI